MKFRDLEKGAHGDGRLFDFELPGGAIVEVRIRPLMLNADGEIERAAEQYATAQKAPPTPGHPTYERGVYAHVLLRAVRDVEDGAPFFGSIEEILGEGGLDRDRLAYLFECQQIVQGEYAPARSKITPTQYVEWLHKTATAEDGIELPFERLPRAMQRHYHRGTARAYLELMNIHWPLVVEADRLRSEIASLQSKYGVGPSSPAEKTNSKSAVPSMSDPFNPMEAITAVEGVPK